MKSTLVLLGTLLALTSSIAQMALPAQAEPGSEFEVPDTPAAMEKLRQEYLTQKAEMEKSMRLSAPLFFEDQHYLARIPFFLPSAGKHDFSSYYNQLKAPNVTTLNLPEALRKLDKTEQIKQARTLDLKGLDFGWMKPLPDYDHFNFTRIESNQALLQKMPYALPVLMQFPDFMLLRQWARLRLLQALNTGEMAQAARESRQLALLMLNSDSLIGSMVAVEMLRDESQIFKAWKVSLPGWEPMSDETLMRARRALRATPGFFMVQRTPADLFKQLSQDPQARVGLCAGMAEGASTLMLHVLDPGERQAQTDEIAQFVKSQHCRVSHIEKLWAEPLVASEAFIKTNFSPAEYQRVKKDRAYRDAIYFLLESVSMPNFMGGYQEPQPAN